LLDSLRIRYRAGRPVAEKGKIPMSERNQEILSSEDGKKGRKGGMRKGEKGGRENPEGGRNRVAEEESTLSQKTTRKERDNGT